MEKLFEFLNQQSGARLFGYACLFIIITIVVMDGLVAIFNPICNKNK